MIVKKSLSVVLSIVLVLFMSACGEVSSDGESSAIKTSQPVSRSDYIASVTSLAADSVEEGNKLKVISYNVRYTDDGENKKISDRAPRLKAVVDKYDPDLMGLQEVTPTWRGILEGYFLDEYDYVYKERKYGDECTPIFWKKDKFEKLEEGHFWLSGLPDRQSKTWGGNCYRIVSWVRLKNKATGTEFLYYNTHYDFGTKIHLKSNELILSRAEQAGAFEEYAMILTGDFNMNFASEEYYDMISSGKLNDVNRALGADYTPTTNGYNENEEIKSNIIDYCFFSPEKAVPFDYKVLNEKINGGYVSDHRGLYIEIGVS